MPSYTPPAQKCRTYISHCTICYFEKIAIKMSVHHVKTCILHISICDNLVTLARTKFFDFVNLWVVATSIF